LLVLKAEIRASRDEEPAFWRCIPVSGVVFGVIPARNGGDNCRDDDNDHKNECNQHIVHVLIVPSEEIDTRKQAIQHVTVLTPDERKLGRAERTGGVRSPAQR
jgi:hypothetical protein